MNNELIKVNVNENQEPVVSARELHEFLEVKTKYKDWFPRMCEYGFIENQDFILVAQKRATNNPKNPTTEFIDHAIKLDMAKEISMIQRNEKGKQARQYFLQLEKDWNSPEKVMARALIMANTTIKSLECKIEEQKPLVQFAETVANNADNIDMGDMAKLCAKEGCNIGRNRLFDLLREKEYLMSNNSPYQRYINSGLFELIEVTKQTPYGEKVFTKTLVTGKGQIKIVELVKSQYNSRD